MQGVSWKVYQGKKLKHKDSSQACLAPYFYHHYEGDRVEFRPPTNSEDIYVEEDWRRQYKDLSVVQTYINTLCNSSFAPYFKPISVNDPYVSMHPLNHTRKEVLAIVSLIRCIWEFPNVPKKVTRWITEGLTPDESLIAGHIDSGSGGGHVVWYNQQVGGSISKMTEMIDKLKSTNYAPYDVNNMQNCFNTKCGNLLYNCSAYTVKEWRKELA